MSKVVAMLALVAFVGSVAMAVDSSGNIPGGAPKDTIVKGSVVKVVEKVVVVSMTTPNGAHDMKIATDDKTVITVDGKEAKIADLKAGMTVEATMPAGHKTVATKIVAVKAPATAPAAGAPSSSK